MAEEEQENQGSGENTEIPLDEKYGIFANKYQIVVSDDSGKLLTMQHPFATVQECEEEVGKIHQRHPNHEIYWDGELKMKWTKLNVYKRGDQMPYSCDFSKSYYSEENP